MLIQTEDFNESQELLNNDYKEEWKDIEQVITGMPLHLKASDQAGLQGNAIFDPVGTNEYIKTALLQRQGWHSNVAIPDKYKFLGTDVDFIRDRRRTNCPRLRKKMSMMFQLGWLGCLNQSAILIPPGLNMQIVDIQEQ